MFEKRREKMIERELVLASLYIYIYLSSKFFTVLQMARVLRTLTMIKISVTPKQMELCVINFR